MSRLLDNLLLFGRILRRAGIAADPERLLVLVQALAYVNLSVREEVYHACRALLVNRQEQIAIFDRAFDAFWREHHEGDDAGDERAEQARAAVATAEAGLEVASMSDRDEIDQESAPADVPVKTWSDLGILADKDFAAFTADEIAQARAALSRLDWNPGERRTRRWVPSE